MKTTISIFIALFISYFTFAQKTINASYLLEKIKNEETIDLKNTIIKGDLDLTFMIEASKKASNKNKWWNWNTGNSNTIEKIINSKISFIDCVFKGDVLAYIPHEESGYTFIASFTENIIFKNCVFKQKAMFKYSKFKENTDFSGSVFTEDSSFKYSVFQENISFENTLFEGESTFKYTNFNNFVSFQNSIFEEDGIFKYTEFNEGVSFNNVKFKEDLNIKYVDVNGEFDITNMDVNYSIDAKYADINGSNFNKHLLKR